jgi:hypothetical protein
MFVLLSRQPRQDAIDWPGRRSLALLDALVWPLGLMLTTVIFNLVPLGVTMRATLLVIALWTCLRCAKAMWYTPQYCFTTLIIAKGTFLLLFIRIAVGWVQGTW